jgi:CheY-like chemotaxis protein
MDEQRLVLAVEDDELTRSFLLDNPAADAFRVAGASGVGEGLRAIEVRQPALAVPDLELEGRERHRAARPRAADVLSSQIDPDLPLIVLSGRAGDADRVRRDLDASGRKPERVRFRCRERGNSTRRAYCCASQAEARSGNEDAGTTLRRRAGTAREPLGQRVVELIHEPALDGDYLPVASRTQSVADPLRDQSRLVRTRNVNRAKPGG